MCLQDKSCSLGPQAVFSLLPDDADVLLVGRFSGLTLSHTAALIAQKDLPYGAQQPTVYACVSDHTEAQRAELQQTMTATGCKSRLPEEASLLCSHSRTVSVRCDERQNKPDNSFVIPEIALGPRWRCPQKYCGTLRRGVL